MKKYLYITIPLLILAVFMSLKFLPLSNLRGRLGGGFFSFFSSLFVLKGGGEVGDSIAQAAAPREGLIGWWTMDSNDMSANGATLYDKSGKNNHGTVTGTTTSTGRIGQARSFNGTTDFVALGDPTILQPTNITISSWFKTSANVGRIIRKGSGGYSIEIGDSDGLCSGANGKMQFWIYNGSSYLCAKSTATYYDNKWHNVVGTFDGSFIRLYVDGVLINTNNQVTSINYIAGGVFIGEDTGGAVKFSGSIDDVRIYNRALSAQEVANLYNSAKKAYIR